jgi:hypothetical protein
MVAVRPLLTFVSYAIWTGMVHPFLFHGITVVSTHGGAQPLSWDTGNLFQVIYLIAVTTLFLLAASITRETLHSSVTWYIRGCLVISLFALYQLANAMLHVPYPSAVLTRTRHW